jgi:sn-glycerol 3-phosphate transport system permease protein
VSRGRGREALLALLFLAPSLIVFGLFVFYPLGRAVFLGRYRGGGGSPRRYVGWEQYRDVWESNEFHDAMITTVKFALITVPIGIALGIGLAVLADKHLRGIGAFRTIFSSTVATSVAVASLMWLFLFQPSVGALANLLPFDVLTSPGLLNDPDTALWAVSITSIWANLGLTFIFITAGMQSIPGDLYESAELDGAGSWMRFTNVTLPMLGPTLLFVLVVLTIRAFQAYGEFDLLTSGGPGNVTTTMTYLIYGNNSVIRNDVGLQSASAVLLFLFLLVLSVVQFRGLERRVHYGR